MPQYFKSKGYETISLGKIYHHHDDDDGIGWSKPSWRPYKDKHNWKGRDYLDPKSWEIMEKSGKKNGGPPFESPDVADGDYPDGMTALKAVEELKRLKESGKPFFLGVGFKKPHLPFNAPKRYWDMYPPESIRLPQQRTWPKGMPSVAANGLKKTWELSNYDALPGKWPLPDDYARTLIRGYYACVTYTDAQIGKVVAELDKLGLSDNTIIVLWGDHGWKLDEYSSWCKHTNFEIDTHAPLMLAAPGHKKNQRSKALVEFVDIFPTLCELCDLDTTQSCEGSSFVPLLDNPGLKWKTAAFSQFPRYKNLMGYTMRYGRWRYTEWIDQSTKVIKHRELYDHATSRIASVNQAGNPEYAELVAKLSSIMDKGQGWKKIKAELK
jgi:arylsulfatase A-like enzyme